MWDGGITMLDYWDIQSVAKEWMLSVAKIIAINMLITCDTKYKLSVMYMLVCECSYNLRVVSALNIYRALEKARKSLENKLYFLVVKMFYFKKVIQYYVNSIIKTAASN